MPGEITRRINAGEAGYPDPVPVKLRAVQEYIERYNTKHGPPSAPHEQDQSADSIDKLKRRLRAIVLREINHYERKRTGKIKPDDAVMLKRHYETLSTMERQDELTQRRRAPRNGKPLPEAETDGKPDETLYERLAREEAEDGAETSSPIDSTDTTEDQDSDAEAPSPAPLPAPAAVSGPSGMASRLAPIPARSQATAQAGQQAAAQARAQ
jgi:hypothetical protein